MDRAIFGLFFAIILTIITYVIIVNEKINVYIAIKIQILVGILALSIQMFIYANDSFWNFIQGLIK